MIYVRANVAIFLRDNYVTCMKMVIPISWKNKRHNFSRTNLLVFHRDLLVRSTLGSNKSGHRSTPITTKSPAHVACLASDQEIVQQHSP